jgi:3-isopropylmalate/(R)-2-methylmalate dehydratase small subunit
MGIAMSIYTGTAHVFGNNVDTDRIIPGKYTKTLNVDNLAEHVLEDLDPGFRSRVRSGDILVAGKNFGAGSSREQAPLALQAAGVTVVVANFFARIFYRNAINIGLPVVEIGPHEILTGHEVEVNLNNGWVTDLTSDQRYRATQMPEVMVRILQAGGLVNYLREHQDYE